MNVKLTFLTLVVVGLVAAPVRADLSAGQIAPNFTLNRWQTSTPVSLYDLQGKIIVLDFFAYWCNPCKTASDELQKYVQAYYAGRGGNNSKIPVQVVSMNIDPAVSSTNSYISKYKLDLVLDATNGVQANDYGVYGIPHFAIINGVAGTNYQQWEIIEEPVGYSAGNYTMFRSMIDGVVAVPEPGTGMLICAGAVALLARRRR